MGITPAIAQELGIQDIRGIIVMRVVPALRLSRQVQQFDIIEHKRPGDRVTINSGQGAEQPQARRCGISGGSTGGSNGTRDNPGRATTRVNLGPES